MRISAVEKSHLTLARCKRPHMSDFMHCIMVSMRAALQHGAGHAVLLL